MIPVYLLAAFFAGFVIGALLMAYHLNKRYDAHFQRVVLALDRYAEAVRVANPKQTWDAIVSLRRLVDRAPDGRSRRAP